MDTENEALKLTKIEDPQIKTQDRALQEHVSEIVTLWNRGKYSFTATATSGPTDTPSDVEFRLFNSGAGTVKLQIFVPGSAGVNGIGWWAVTLTEITS